MNCIISKHTTLQCVFIQQSLNLLLLNCTVLSALCLFFSIYAWADETRGGEVCGDKAEYLTPIEYNPFKRADTTAATSNTFTTRGLSFELQGELPCTNHDCQMNVVSFPGKHIVASVDMKGSSPQFCRQIITYQPNEIGNNLCNQTYIQYISSILLDDPQGNFVRRVIQIYYSFALGKPTKPLAEHCAEPMNIDGQLYAKVWTFVDTNLATIDLAELDFFSRKRTGSTPPAEPLVVKIYGFHSQ